MREHVDPQKVPVLVATVALLPASVGSDRRSLLIEPCEPRPEQAQDGLPYWPIEERKVEQRLLATVASQEPVPPWTYRSLDEVLDILRYPNTGIGLEFP